MSKVWEIFTPKNPDAQEAEPDPFPVVGEEEFQATGQQQGGS